MNRWTGKVAFVTGANGGIGMAITKRLLDLGLTVVAIDKQTELLLVSTRRPLHYRDRVCEHYGAVRTT